MYMARKRVHASTISLGLFSISVKNKDQQGHE